MQKKTLPACSWQAVTAALWLYKLKDSLHWERVLNKRSMLYFNGLNKRLYILYCFNNYLQPQGYEFNLLQSRKYFMWFIVSMSVQSSKKITAQKILRSSQVVNIMEAQAPSMLSLSIWFRMSMMFSTRKHSFLSQTSILGPI